MSRKPTPLEAFDDNMRDAYHLVLLAESLTNERARRMRKELRERVGDAWRVPVKERDELDCLESDDVYMTFKAGSRVSRETFRDHRPALRQALVAACAAAETYLADTVMSQISELTSSVEAATPRLKDLPMSVGDWLYIEENYQRRRWGLHGLVIERQVRHLASTAPTRVGQMLTLIGVKNWSRQLDNELECGRGETEELLRRVTERRNRIVHTGDRDGRGRARLSLDEVKEELRGMESVVHAIETVLV